MLSGLFSHSAAGAADFSHLEQASVEFRHVDKRYGDHQVLNDINLTITPGEVVAILGPSGSGKSTLIRLINQLETLSGGEILVDNKPTAKLSGSGLRQLLSRVGFVFQQFNLYAHLTASQNITLALGIKALFMALALTGQATLWMAVFADVGASLLVVGNGLRLLNRPSNTG